MSGCRIVLLLIVCLPGIALAEPTPEDGTSWLQRIASSAHGLNYSGTFVYRHGGYMESSHIVHLSDANGEHEKLELLDGPPREIIRNNDEVVCFMPDNKSVIVERRKSQKSFPALLPQQLSGIQENYAIRLGGMGRVAGRDCRYLEVEPRDIYRYGHRFCADRLTGLLLKASTLNEQGEVVDQFVFTQVNIGGVIDRDQLQSKFSIHRQVEMPPNPNGAADPGWQVGSLPSGFKKIMALKRSFPGKKYPANHLVFSDDLVAVSVFIEPLAGVDHPTAGLSSQGAINVYTRPINDHQITVLGEVPSVTVKQIANSVTHAAK